MAEKDAEFDRVCHKVPPVNSVQMYKFLNPPKSFQTIPASKQQIWLPTKLKAIFPTSLIALDGLALWKRTFLNDAIIGAYISVLNSITVLNRNALFIPPTTSSSWQNPAYEHQYRRLCVKRSRAAKA